MSRLENKVAKVIQLLLLLAMAVAFYQKKWLPCFAAFLGLLLTFLPEVLEKKQGIFFPKWIQIIYFLFIYSSIGLRRVESFL